MSSPTCLCVRNVDGHLAFSRRATGQDDDNFTVNSWKPFCCNRAEGTGREDYVHRCAPRQQCAACFVLNHTRGSVSSTPVAALFDAPQFLLWTAWTHKRSFGITYACYDSAIEAIRIATVSRLRLQCEKTYLALRRCGFMHDIADLVLGFAMYVTPAQEMELWPGEPNPSARAEGA